MLGFLFNLLLLPLLRFFVNAFALKLAVGVVSKPGQENDYGTAVTISALLSILGFVLGFFPFGGVLHIVVWVMAVRSIYNLSVSKSIGVGALQWGLGILLMWGLKFIGLGM